MADLFNIIWNISLLAVSDWFMQSDFALLIYIALISSVVCYFINLVKLLKKY